MTRSCALASGMALVLGVAACGGDTCESVQDQIQEIGRDVQKDPQLAMDEDIQQELSDLRDKLQEMGCLG